MEFILNKDNSQEIFLFVSDEIIPNIRPWYYISDHGNIFSANSNRLLKPTKSADGYNVCTVRTIDGRGITIYIHRIEMLTFKFESGCESLDIDHVDCNKSNNYIVNLEWVTKGENTRRAAANGLLLTGEQAPWTKVSNIDVGKICNMYVQGYGISDIAKIIGCGIDSVFRIVHGIGRTDISSNYDIESRYRGILTDEQIHMICSIYQNFNYMRYSDLKVIISDTLNIKINRDIDSILRNLYRHDIYCFYNISKLYKY